MKGDDNENPKKHMVRLQVPQILQTATPGAINIMEKREDRKMKRLRKQDQNRRRPALRIGGQFNCDRLGLVTIYDVESDHSIVVVDLKGRYYRMSGLCLNQH